MSWFHRHKRAIPANDIAELMNEAAETMKALTDALLATELERDALRGERERLIDHLKKSMTYSSQLEAELYQARQDVRRGTAPDVDSMRMALEAIAAGVEDPKGIAHSALAGRGLAGGAS